MSGISDSLCFHFECGRGSLQARTNVDLCGGADCLGFDVVLNGES